MRKVPREVEANQAVVGGGENDTHTQAEAVVALAFTRSL